MNDGQVMPGRDPSRVDEYIADLHVQHNAEVPDGLAPSRPSRRAGQENLDEARRFVRALAPTDLESATLTAALQRLCASTTTRTGIPVSFHEVGHLPALATPIDVALLRIAQSALGNVVQHAHPSRADVMLTSMDTAVTLDVVDDGIGFDTRAAVGEGQVSMGQGGFGLRSMRSRAADVGGVLGV